ncbi:MAG TPA: DUF4198 domain-containing protein [Gemmataceae bacterium]|nr:DUF4198 domain-containing protein [Gemmataceae bacterium]
MHLPTFRLAGLLILAWAETGSAHYHVLLPDKSSVERDQPVRFTLRFGHPFEHQMFPCQRPQSVAMLAPDGRWAEFAEKLEKDQGGAFRWDYTPAVRGDHIAFVRCAPEWMADEKIFLEDSVKVILHVQTQNGWDRPVAGLFGPGQKPPPGVGVDLVPLTRPYGLRAGTVFQVSVLSGIADPARALPGTLVEVERYNPTPPKQLPPDEHITRTAKTDPNGVATVSLPDPGWWAITAVRDGGTRMKDGQSFPAKVRTTLWVPVDNKIPLTPVK